MAERKQDEKTDVWTDLLIILVLSNFVLENVPQWQLAPVFLVAFAFFASLRSRFVGKWTRRVSAIAAAVIFLRDVYLFQGPEEFFKVLALLAILAGLYFILRRFLRFFPM